MTTTHYYIANTEGDWDYITSHVFDIIALARPDDTYDIKLSIKGRIVMRTHEDGEEQVAIAVTEDVSWREYISEKLIIAKSLADELEKRLKDGDRVRVIALH